MLDRNAYSGQHDQRRDNDFEDYAFLHDASMMDF